MFTETLPQTVTQAVTETLPKAVTQPVTKIVTDTVTKAVSKAPGPPAVTSPAGDEFGQVVQ